METLSQSFAFLATLIAAFFVPGLMVWRAIFGRSFSRLEEVVFAFLASIALVDLVMLILDRIGAPLSLPVVGSTIFFVTLIAGAFAWRQGHLSNHEVPSETFSPRVNLLLFTLFALTLFIRTLFLGSNILPTATDLGHHMYWSAVIAETESIPPYEKIEVVTDPATGSASIAPPKPIADFIIGEHLPFAFFAELSGLSFTDAFPILFLFVINLLSLLALLLLAYRLATALAPGIRPEWVALGTLLLIGPLFAIASPQAKFVSGGVVGNIFGNLFIPAILLLFYRGFAERRGLFFAAAITFSFFLAYTHHLSTLILAFVLVAVFLLLALSHLRNDRAVLRHWFRLALSPAVLAVLVSTILFMVLIALPSYLDTRAIDSAIGTPTKATRTGLTFAQVGNSIGLGRVALGLCGIAIGCLLLIRRRAIEGSFFAGWGGILLVMALFPEWVFLDIPSGRVGSYLAYPLALASGLALAVILREVFERKSLPASLATVAFGALIVFVVGSGSADNAGSLTEKNRSPELVQTFAATEWLARHSNGEMILKDHNYLSSDAWMKLFFLRDYGYPLSRGLFGRYQEGGNRRERCTLAMISTPNTTEGIRCYEETGVRYLVVNPEYDRAQFEKSDSFSKLYTSQTAAIFERDKK